MRRKDFIRSLIGLPLAAKAILTSQKIWEKPKLEEATHEEILQNKWEKSLLDKSSCKWNPRGIDINKTGKGTGTITWDPELIKD